MKHFRVWGKEGIDQNTMDQMETAMQIPVCVAGALMPDAHLGYGLPIGGVFALDNAVCPYAVGVDIACRMELSVFPVKMEPEFGRDFLGNILEENTYFGVGVEHSSKPDHPVLSEDWGVSSVTKEHFETARAQLGTSGSGNHFVEWGEYHDDKGTWLALMSHSGSRGVGAKVCNFYSKLAKVERPGYGELAWFDLDEELGQEYWAAMQLMGRYASANHDVIHDGLSKALGMKPMTQIENHHNFAWKEDYHGREVIVHRKGATPAGEGVMGIIPGSMGTRAYIVSGRGSLDSINSSSHGAGRVMSRKQAKKTFDYQTEIDKLASKGITVLSAGTDEVVGVYKDIHKVMDAQIDLVRIKGFFYPKIVKMAPAKKRKWEK